MSLVKCLFPGLDGFCSVGSGYVSTSSSTSVVCQARELVSLLLVLGFSTLVALSVVQSFLQLPKSHTVHTGHQPECRISLHTFTIQLIVSGFIAFSITPSACGKNLLVLVIHH